MPNSEFAAGPMISVNAIATFICVAVTPATPAGDHRHVRSAAFERRTYGRMVLVTAHARRHGDVAVDDQVHAGEHLLAKGHLQPQQRRLDIDAPVAGCLPLIHSRIAQESRTRVFTPALLHPEGCERVHQIATGALKLLGNVIPSVTLPVVGSSETVTVATTRYVEDDLRGVLPFQGSIDLGNRQLMTVRVNV